MDKVNKLNSQQRKFWLGEFGSSYLERNLTLDNVDERYKQETGITRKQIFNQFFQKINKNSKILELGCNVGLNLLILKNMGFTNLYGLELSKSALQIASKNMPDITFIHSSIEEYNPKGMMFDLVFTVGVLIHIDPKALRSIIKKIVSLTKNYIFGFEYFSNNLTEIEYRSQKNVCWKQNFPLLYRKIEPNLKLIKEKKIHYKNKDLIDTVYLLQKIDSNLSSHEF